jgi:pimeloyl-ACP methyl ester carboxylesterase
MNQPEVDDNKITVLGYSEGTVISPRLAIDNPDKVNNIVLMGALAQNMSEILYFQTITLPISYAQKVLDKNHNGLLSLQEAGMARSGKFVRVTWFGSRQVKSIGMVPRRPRL